MLLAVDQFLEALSRFVGRKECEVDVDKHAADALRANYRNDRAIEIDAYPDRQDIDVDLLRLARETGVRISIGSDAHATDQLSALDYGVAAARLADIPAERIVNCMRAEEVIAWTRSSGSGGRVRFVS